MDGVDVGVWSASPFQGLEKSAAALDCCHRRESTREALRPNTDAAAEIEDRTVLLHVTSQSFNDPGFRPKAEIPALAGKPKSSIM